VFKEGDAWTGCVYKHVCTSKKNRQKGCTKNLESQIHRSSIEGDFAVILEHQRVDFRGFVNVVYASVRGLHKWKYYTRF
jgi:hypothetical protein